MTPIPEEPNRPPRRLRRQRNGTPGRILGSGRPGDPRIIVLGDPAKPPLSWRRLKRALRRAHGSAGA